MSNNASILDGRDAALRRPVGVARRPYLTQRRCNEHGITEDISI